MEINSFQSTSYLPATQEPAVAQNSGQGFSYAMGQASAAGSGQTPAVAQSLMYRSMTTGVPTFELDKYGGYDAVKAMFDANGGTYSLDAIPAQQRQQLAQVVANSGVGNMQLLLNEHVAIAPAALDAMAQNGIDQNTINSLQEKTKDGQQPSTSNFLNTAAKEADAHSISTITPAVAQSLMYRSMTTGLPTAEFDQYGGYGAVKAMFDANGGSYSLDAIPSYQRQQLAQVVANTGVGNMQFLINENVALAPAALDAMAQNGIDQNTINSLQEKTKDGQQPSTSNFLNTAAKEADAHSISTITPAVAQSLMYRSMTTGLPTAEFDQYGGYGAVKAMFDANGGSYSLDAIPADQRKAMAMLVASSGVGNMSAPITEKIGVSSAALQAMASNGIDKATIDQITQKTSGFAQAPFVDSNSYINIFMKAIGS